MMPNGEPQGDRRTKFKAAEADPMSRFRECRGSEALFEAARKLCEPVQCRVGGTQ